MYVLLYALATSCWSCSPTCQEMVSTPTLPPPPPTFLTGMTGLSGFNCIYSASRNTNVHWTWTLDNYNLYLVRIVVVIDHSAHSQLKLRTSYKFRSFTGRPAIFSWLRKYISSIHSKLVAVKRNQSMNCELPFVCIHVSGNQNIELS